MNSRSLPSWPMLYWRCVTLRPSSPSRVHRARQPLLAAVLQRFAVRTISSPFEFVLALRKDIFVWRESTQTLVNRPVSGSKPIMPVPVVFPIPC